MDAGTVKWFMTFVAGSNLVAYLAFSIDKRRAENGAWRIPERTLLTFAFLRWQPRRTAGAASLSSQDAQGAIQDISAGDSLVSHCPCSAGVLFSASA
jgi:Protein of unknown function (DUF1294)